MLAADRGQAAAAFNLGVSYDYGKTGYQKIVPKQSNTTLHPGLCADQPWVRSPYIYGDGAARDYAQAWKFYQLAGKQGGAEGQYNSAKMLWQALGVPPA